MPTMQFFRKGEKVNEIVGGDANGLRMEVAKASVPALARALRLDALTAALVTSPKQAAMLLAALAYMVTPWQRVLKA